MQHRSDKISANQKEHLQPRQSEPTNAAAVSSGGLGETPRTDSCRFWTSSAKDDVVWADFARGLERENAKMRGLLERIRTEPNLLKRGGASGQDQYAGMPAAYALIDSELKRPWTA